MLKWRFPFLTDNDFTFEEGKRESMLDRLSQKLKKSRGELELLFEELQRY